MTTWAKKVMRVIEATGEHLGCNSYEEVLERTVQVEQELRLRTRWISEKEWAVVGRFHFAFGRVTTDLEAERPEYARERYTCLLFCWKSMALALRLCSPQFRARVAALQWEEAEQF